MEGSLRDFKMVLFVNASFRDGSRTLRLARHYLKRYNASDVVTVDLGDAQVDPLNRLSLKIYNDSVASASYDDKMFDLAKQFAAADEIVIAAPFWNFSIPAALHSYLELACTQGISFDVTADGRYYSLCRAKTLTYITTAGGYIPENDHAFGYIKCLSDMFWNFKELRYFKADGIDIKENNAEDILNAAVAEMDK